MSWVTNWLPVRLRWYVALYAPTYPYILIYLTVLWVTIGLPVLLRVVSVVQCRTTHTNSYPPIYLTVIWVTIWLPVRPYIGKLRILEMLGFSFSVLTKHLILPRLFIITILTIYITIYLYLYSGLGN